MEVTIFVNLTPKDVTDLAEMAIVVLGVIIALLLVVRPYLTRLRGGSGSLGKRQAIDDGEEAGRPGMVKVSVWVPETNAPHIQLLAKELRRGGTPKNGQVRSMARDQAKKTGPEEEG